MSDAKDKRKQGEDDAVSDSQQKKARQDGSSAVTDKEVEEFYAILRRLNTAVKYFKRYGDDVAALEKDIMQEVKEATRNEKEGHLEENLNLDLNVTPQNPT